MRFKHLRTLLEAEERIASISGIAWSPNNSKLAVCTADRVIHLFDDKGEKKDKFSTKPVDAKYGKDSYAVRGLAFSPDSTMIAVGQTDNIIFVYYIGEHWGEKKVINHKFIVKSAVTCLIWLDEGPMVFGQADGMVRHANINTNKTHCLYITNSLVITLTANMEGNGFLSGHLDGTIIRFYVSNEGVVEQQGRVAKHPVPPYALAWPVKHIIAAGCDQRVVIYSREGHILQQFDYSRDDTEKEFTAACCSPTGFSVILGSFDRIRVFNWNASRSSWEEGQSCEIKYLYTVAALGWKRDGTRVTVGSSCGGVELFESVIKRYTWKNKFEITFVGPSHVVVKPLLPGLKGAVVKSRYGYDIECAQIMGQDRYLVARSSGSLLVSDMRRNRLSEVLWHNSDRSEKFYFKNENVCLIFNAGELSLVEYGENKILGSVRSEFMNPHVISVRLNEQRQNNPAHRKKLAYLLDLKTICILDLFQGGSVKQVPHDSKIDWLELNETGEKLLFRDKKMRLTLFDIVKDQKSTILNFCSFVQWVVGSDVAVAQSRSDLCIWYNIDTPDKLTTVPIRGNIVEVVRAEGRTEVIIQEGKHQLAYVLDEGLVEFGTAIHDNDLKRAMTFLETLGDKPEAEGMWEKLAVTALGLNKLHVAEHCYAVLQNVSKVRYLRKTIDIADEYAKENDVDGMTCPDVGARLAILNKRLKDAEAIYLQNNMLEKAIEMYCDLYKWDQALALAEAKGFPDLPQLKEKYMQWLLKSNQEEKAAEIKEEEGDFNSAFELYLKANSPVRASRLLQCNYKKIEHKDAMQRVITALLYKELYEHAGDLYEFKNQPKRAIECFKKGKAFAKAIELARFYSPAEVVVLEEQWGDHLVASNQLDAAISHYIEAGKTRSALDAAVGAKQWKKAVQIIQVIDDPTSVVHYYKQIAEYFASVKEYSAAEKLFVQAELYGNVIDMYNEAGEWERAYQLASQYLEPEQVSKMYFTLAQNLEKRGKFKDAEKLYIAVKNPDEAISMYKKNKQFDQMIHLVGEYHPDLLPRTHLKLAEEMMAEGNFRVAERHFLGAEEWKSAVHMYLKAEMWEDAHRVAKNHGSTPATVQVLYLWAKCLGGESAVKLFKKYNLLERGIDYACEDHQFEFAFDLARLAMESKLPEVHTKHANALEDDGKFEEAEEKYILAGKPKEAVLMYMDKQDWTNALRVAKEHDPDSVRDVLVAESTEALALRNFQRFEALLLQADKPEEIVRHYKEAAMWPDALRICRKFLPSQLSAVQQEYEREVANKGSSNASSLIAMAHDWKQAGDHKNAIECLLKVSSSESTDPALVAEALVEASELVKHYLDGQEAKDVVKIVGPQLVGLDMHKEAAELYIGHDMIKETVDMLFETEDWMKARKIAEELEPGLVPYVEDHYKEYLRRKGKVEQLAEVDIIAALDLLAEQYEWVRCLDMAADQGPPVLHKYVALFATQLIKEGHPMKALGLYTEYEAPPYPQNFNIYKRMCLDIFKLPGLSGPDAYDKWSQLRNVLLQLTQSLKSSAGSSAHDEFNSFLVISHYYASRCAYEGIESLEDVVAKLSISLLRHSDIIPADKAYYEAGVHAKAVGRETEAFVFLNHYLDIYEATEEKNPDLLDYRDFMATDFPVDVPLPSRIQVLPSQHEEVKEWVLAMSMDQSFVKELPLDDRMVYASSLSSGLDFNVPACVISGAPILEVEGQNLIEFKKEGMVANGVDWNKVLMAAKMSPQSHIPDVLSFISRWCGDVPLLSFK